MRERVKVVEHRPDCGGVAPVDGEENLPHRLAGLGKRVVDLQLHRIEYDFACQCVAVGVQARGRVANQLVPRGHPVAMQRLVFLDHADDRPGEIVVAGLIQIRHLCRFAAGERHVVRPAGARDTRDNLLGDLRHEVPSRDVIEERERCGPVHQNVVDRMIDEILADGVVNARRRGDEDFRSHAIGRHHQHGLLETIGHADHAAEPADLAPGERCPRGAHELRDAPFRFGGSVQLHAGRGVAIRLGHSSPSSEKCTRSRNAFTRPRTSLSVTCSRRCTPNASTASDPMAEP